MNENDERQRVCHSLCSIGCRGYKICLYFTKTNIHKATKHWHFSVFRHRIIYLLKLLRILKNAYNIIASIWPGNSKTTSGVHVNLFFFSFQSMNSSIIHCFLDIVISNINFSLKLTFLLNMLNCKNVIFTFFQKCQCGIFTNNFHPKVSAFLEEYRTQGAEKWMPLASKLSPVRSVSNL